MDPKRKRLPVSMGQFLERFSHFLGINLSSYISKLYSLALAVPFLLCAYLTWYDLCTDHCMAHLGRRVMIILQFSMYTLLVLMVLGTSVFRPKQFAFPRHEMLTVDSILESYGARASGKDIVFVQYLQNAIIMAGVLFTGMRFIYQKFFSNEPVKPIWVFVHFFYTINYSIIIDGLFLHYVNDVYLRYRELNKIAEQHWREELSVAYIHFTATNRGNAFNERKDTVVTKIRSIQHIHHRLYIVAKKVNKNFGLPLLIISIVSLDAMILFLHDAYYMMIENTKLNDSAINAIILNVIFALGYASRSLYVSYICQRSRNESRQMMNILHNVFLKYKSLRAEVIHFSLQLIHEDLTFTAFGLYEINIPFMCSVAGAVLTYLVMVVQLDTEKFNFLNTTLGYTDGTSTSANDNS